MVIFNIKTKNTVRTFVILDNELFISVPKEGVISLGILLGEEIYLSQALKNRACVNSINNSGDSLTITTNNTKISIEDISSIEVFNI